MSKEKVDAYKEAKKNRKETIAKEKKMKKANSIIGWVIGALVVGALIVGLVITINNINSGTSADDAFKTESMGLPDYSDIRGTSEETSSEEETSETESEESSEETSESESVSEESESIKN